jgi:Tol biopolymer transport system component
VLLEHRVKDHAEREIFPTSSSVGLTFVALNSDGSKIAVVLHESGPPTTRRVVVMEVAGGPPITLTEFSGPGNHITFPRWSADARSVLFAFRKDYESPPELWKVDVANGARTRYTLPMDVLQQVATAPDGLEVAFIGGSRENDEGVWLLENFLPASTAPAVQKPVAPTAKK